ncbi:cell division protein FtsL [Rhizobium sp. RAF56]|jgi:hypothetical protein|uniref:cell division protein FtsL n=1 Tax=Rhizobium sp. RAF56 TaxID=3233062 RepID=UPI003F9BDE7A
MLKTFDIILIGLMTATATITYTIKHRAELKMEEVHRLEAEIKLEKDTIDLLQADWALVVQPNRLEKLANIYNGELKLQPTVSTALAQPTELPMLRSQLPPPDIADKEGAPIKGAAATGDSADAEIRRVIADVAAKPAAKPVAKTAGAVKHLEPKDNIKTGSVKN